MARMFSSKKGLGIGQVFIFMIAALSFSLIMIFGYKMIQGFINGGNEVAFVQFKNDLESSVRKIYTEYGSVRTLDYHLPSSFSKICFLDLGYDAPLEELERQQAQLSLQNPIASGVWQDLASTPAQSRYEATDENVFLTPPAKVKIKIHRISIYDPDTGERKVSGFLCKEIKDGTFSLTLIGKGDHTGLLNR